MLGIVTVKKAGKNDFLSIEFEDVKVSSGQYEAKGFHDGKEELSKHQFKGGASCKINGMDTTAMKEHLALWNSVNNNQKYQLSLFYKGRKSIGKNPNVWSWMAKLLQAGIPEHIDKTTRAKWTPFVAFTWIEKDVINYATNLQKANLGGFRQMQPRFLPINNHNGYSDDDE